MYKNHISIIKHLLTDKALTPSIREISLKCGMDYKTAYLELGQLEKEELITITKRGKSSIVKLNKSTNPSIYAAEYSRAQDIMKNKDLAVIQSDLSRIPKPLICLLFGSYAKGTSTRHSDIDLLTISEALPEIDRLISSIPLNIHHTNVSYQEFLGMAKSSEFSVVQEAIRNNIILIGIEEYYRLLSNAHRGTYS